MILITGGLGFIGSHVTRALLDQGESCVLVQRRAAGPPSLLAAEDGTRLFTERADVTDLAALREIGGRHKVTGIVHLAGGFGLDLSDPVGAAQRGTEGLLNLFQLAAEWQVTRIGVASTIGVYDGPGESPLREDTGFRPGWAATSTWTSPGCARTPGSGRATTPRPRSPTTSAGSAPATSADGHER